MERTPAPEARLVETEAGLRPERDDGRFVVNVGDAMSVGIDDGQYGFVFEGRHGNFPHFGLNITVLGPGKPGAMITPRRARRRFWSSRASAC